MVGLLLRDDPKPDLMPHMFTKWSRAQLLSHLGTKEKWFGTVTKEREAEELNARMHALQGFMFRTMRSFDDERIRIVRGLVSSSFGDIPDIEIMKALVEVMPGAYALRGYSGKTDRAMYAYVITSDPIKIPGTAFLGFPGVVVKNSEVAYTALSVIPALYMPGFKAPIVVEKDIVLRRIHRGSFEEMVSKFREAIDKTKVLWGPLTERLGRLRSTTYTSEDEAVAAMSALLIQSHAQKWYALRAEQIYRKAHRVVHDAGCIFEAILELVNEQAGQDDAYTTSAVAGAVVMQLTK